MKMIEKMAKLSLIRKALPYAGTAAAAGGVGYLAGTKKGRKEMMLKSKRDLPKSVLGSREAFHTGAAIGAGSVMERILKHLPEVKTREGYAALERSLQIGIAQTRERMGGAGTRAVEATGIMKKAVLIEKIAV